MIEKLQMTLTDEADQSDAEDAMDLIAEGAKILVALAEENTLSPRSGHKEIILPIELEEDLSVMIVKKYRSAH